MKGSFKVLMAMFLALLWLPATSHCALDAVSDLITDICASDCDHPEDRGPSHDHPCLTIESGDYTGAAASAHAPAPSLVVLACVACLHSRMLLQAPCLAPPAVTRDHPQDWIPGWTFAVRAAPPARAPNLI
jgi:hypothetical protein